MIHAGEQHVHGEVVYDKELNNEVIQSFKSAPGRTSMVEIPAGNYYLTEDVTLTAHITLADADYNGTIRICLNGHILDCNGYGFDYGEKSCVNCDMTRTGYKCIEAEITDCKETCHKYRVENNKWILDEENGTEKIYGGVITSRDYCNAGSGCIYSDLGVGLTKFNNINFVGSDFGIQNPDDGGTYLRYLISISQEAEIEECNFVGNYFDDYTTGYILMNTQYGSEKTIVKNCYFSNNYSSLDPGVYEKGIICKKTEYGSLLITDTTIENNKFTGGGLWLDGNSKVELGGTVIIRNNGIEKEQNLYIKNFYSNVDSILINQETGLDTDSSIGLSFRDSPEKNKAESFTLMKDKTYSYSDLADIFYSDNRNYFVTAKTNCLEYKNIIKEQPDSTNEYGFILDSDFLNTSGIEVSYKWKSLKTEEIKHNPLTETQNYIDLSDKLDSRYIPYIPEYKDGKWNTNQGAALFGVHLNKGDTIFVEGLSQNNTGTVRFALDKFPMFGTYTEINSAKASSYIEKSGDYYFVISGEGFVDGFCFYLLKEDKTLVNRDKAYCLPEKYGAFNACFAKIKKNGESYVNLMSNVVEKDGYKVSFVYGDTDLYTRPYLNIIGGSKISKPSDPDGWQATEWYKEPELINKWDFSKDEVNGNITLYAKYEPAVDVIGGNTMNVGATDKDVVMYVGAGLDGLSIANFESITIDGTEYKKSDLQQGTDGENTYYYNDDIRIETGCLKVTFSKDYMNKLRVGNHEVEFSLSGTLGTLDLSKEDLKTTIKVKDPNSYKVVNTSVK